MFLQGWFVEGSQELLLIFSHWQSPQSKGLLFVFKTTTFIWSLLALRADCLWRGSSHLGSARVAVRQYLVKALSLTSLEMRLDVGWDFSWSCVLEQLNMVSVYGPDSSEHGCWDALEKERERSRNSIVFSELTHSGRSHSITSSSFYLLDVWRLWLLEQRPI